MRILAIVVLATAVCLGSVAESRTISVAPADAFLDWTVSPGTLVGDVWTLPEGTTTLTASVVDEFGDPITEGQLVWETCSGSGSDLGTHHPAADCQQPGPVRWRGAVIIDLANPRPINPCFCAGVQQGFRLVYRSRRSGFRSTTGEPFDLFANMSCPSNCP
jgi:hypothetical protein